MLKINYDKESDILSIQFSDSEIVESEYSEDSGIVLDYDKNKKIQGLEVTAFSKRSSNPDEILSIAG